MHWTLALYLSQEDTTAAAPAAANGSALLEMIHNSGPVAFAVLVILLLASIFSWAIMISKWSRFGRAHTQSLRFLRAFRKSTRLSEIAAVAEQFKPSPLVAVVGYNQLTARLREFAARMDDFGRELLNAIENAAMMTPPAPPQQTEEIRRRTF